MEPANLGENASSGIARGKDRHDARGGTVSSMGAEQLLHMAGRTCSVAPVSLLAARQRAAIEIFSPLGNASHNSMDVQNDLLGLARHLMTARRSGFMTDGPIHS
jgi:hypothetical protein